MGRLKGKVSLFEIFRLNRGHFFDPKIAECPLSCVVARLAVPRGQTRGFAALSGLSTPSRLAGASRQARRSTLRRVSAGGESESRMQDASARALVRPPPERKVASQL
jgi:hypothetical protein